MGDDAEDPYGGDWADLGGWPDPALPPDEDDSTQEEWPAEDDAGLGDGEDAGAG